ncbi:MAG: Cof-type HAD-IIB family hydrolase [Oscillospiraceae bacterium]|nr:Cof-type HAD-IIB family hydrolase [Oscillospiraceae bacterium]
MYKLIAIDLDGTLLNSYGEISEKNKNAIREAMNMGTEVVLASGRIIGSILNLSQEIGNMNYLIAGNGSNIYDIKNEELIYNKYMDKEKALKLAKICQENSMFYSVYTESGIITKSLNHNVLFYHNENVNKTEEKKININVTEDVLKYIEKSNLANFPKIVVCDHDKEIFQSIIKKLNQVKHVDVLDVGHMSRKFIENGTEIVPIEYYYTEITNENVNKWNALEFLMEKLNIKAEEVMVIGDNVNDIKMVENAGLGVIMGNAAPYIKETANVVVSDNNSDGVAEAIEGYALET